MINIAKSIAQIAVMVAVTIPLRLLPFWIFPPEKKIPAWVEFIGRVLPYSISAILVIYCLKDISFAKVPFGAPDLIAAAVTAILHICKKNMLLSVGVGTLCYMLLIRIF